MAIARMSAATHWHAAMLDLENSVSVDDPEQSDWYVARAQVHATLAQAGAIILASAPQVFNDAHQAMLDAAAGR